MKVKSSNIFIKMQGKRKIKADITEKHQFLIREIHNFPDKYSSFRIY